MTRPGGPAERTATVPSAARLAELRDRYVRSSALGSRLVDDWGRDHDNLRISVTARCNFACSFCHNEGQGFAPWEAGREPGRPSAPGEGAGWEAGPSPGRTRAPGEGTLGEGAALPETRVPRIPPGRAAEMTPSEIERAARVAAGFGLTRMKLTGGEPTLRPDLPEIVARLRPWATDLSMTTNGLLLPRLARLLADAGLDRVNVSLHSLDRGVFARVTGRDLLPQVLAGIDAAVDAGLAPVKVNAVVMRDHNRDELPALAAFARDRGLVLQLIELDSPDDDHFGPFAREQHASLRPLEDRLLRHASVAERRRMHGRVQVVLRGAEPFGPLPAAPTSAPAAVVRRVLPVVSGNGLLLASGLPDGAPHGAAPAARRKAPSGPSDLATDDGAAGSSPRGAAPVPSPSEPGQPLRVELVRPQGNRAFCAACTRIRVTADGAWKSCLNRDDNHVPFLSALRAGASDEDLEGLLLECIARREPYWR